MTMTFKTRIGWQCASCNAIVVEHNGNRPVKCACGGNTFSASHKVLLPKTDKATYHNRATLDKE